ncbi:MAG: hypothetical protein GY806_18800, partial [Gammaproteobacteria bacterium]|nr:hypothetical protein [Gammaproteobacteria bacterium]
TVVERNKIIDCDRGIGFGLGNNGHIGGIIRNNMVYTTRDVGIGLESSSNTKVYNNTVYSTNYFDSIEYRWPATTGVEITNNLTNLPVENRDGASASVQNNIITAQSSWFVDVTSGDLHLSSPIPNVIDQGFTLAEVTDDIDKESRPNGNGYDIGADEYGGSIPVTYYLLNITKNGPGGVTSSPGGIDCGSVCASEFEENTIVTLTATPESGAEFVNW